MPICFIDGCYSHEVSREPDGRYYLCFDNRQTMRLVAVGLGSGDSVQARSSSLGRFPKQCLRKAPGTLVSPAQ